MAGLGREVVTPGGDFRPRS